MSKENITAKSLHEEISNQIDRLNKTIGEVMSSVECSSKHRKTPHHSFQTPYENQEDSIISESSNFIDSHYDQTIESLLLNQDRQQMIIEDFRSEEHRKSFKDISADIRKIRKELWLEVKSQHSKLVSQEKRRLEGKMLQADQMKEEFIAKSNEVQDLIAKLKQKEEQLREKENELSDQKLRSEKIERDLKEKNEVNSEEKIIQKSKFRSISLLTGNEQGEKALQDQLKTLEIELRHTEGSLENIDYPENKEMKIESIKNKIASVRSDIAVNYSNKRAFLVNNMLGVLQKKTEKNESMKNNEIFQANKENSKQTTLLLPSNLNTSQCRVENKRILCSENQDPIHLKADKLKENNEFNQEWIEKKVKCLNDKEKELFKREAFLQRTWMRVPGARELVENVNLTIAKLNGERMLFQKEKKDFEKEKMEWRKSRT